MMPLAFVDTETTGLHQDKQLWEVAIIRRDFYKPGEVITYIDGETAPVPGKYKETRYEAFVPVDLSNADLFGLNVGRFYDRHPMGRYLSGKLDARDWDESWEESVPDRYVVAANIAKFTHGARFIGAVPSFDAEVLGDFLRKHGLLPSWHYHLVDVCELGVGFSIGRGAGPVNDLYSSDGVHMDQLADLLGVPPLSAEARHTAMGDAQFAADIWDAVMR